MPSFDIAIRDEDSQEWKPATEKAVQTTNIENAFAAAGAEVVGYYRVIEDGGEPTYLRLDPPREEYGENTLVEVEPGTF